MANYQAALFNGHGYSEVTGGYDPGAVNGSVKENDLARAINAEAKKYLDTIGLNIHYDENNYTDKDLAGNTYSTNTALVTHINAGGGRRSELYAPAKEKHLDSDFQLLKDLESIGLTNGGVKSRDYDSEDTFFRKNGVALNFGDYYGEIRDAWNRGVSLSIFEVGFIDSTDLSIIQNNIKYIGYCVAKYIATNCGVALPPFAQSQPTVPPTQPLPDGTMLRVVCGSYKDRANAETMQSKLKAAGFDSFLVAYNK